jgi:hypothetical protein
MAFRRAVLRRFYSQRDTPTLPQMPVEPIDFKARVGYFISRNAIVKHDPHPIEQEIANVVERDHQRYARLDDESALHFFQRSGISIDVANRSDPAQIQADFFGNEAYAEALHATAKRFAPAKRLQAADYYDPFDESLANGPPKRQTLNRKLAEYLFLIVREAQTGKWTVPSISRHPSESLRMTLDRAVATQHPRLSTFCFSNCPQGVVKNYAGTGEPLYVFATTYLSGRPSIEDMAGHDDHAWVSRSELAEYEFVPDAFELLRDIAVSNYFDGRGLH